MFQDMFPFRLARLYSGRWRYDVVKHVVLTMHTGLLVCYLVERISSEALKVVKAILDGSHCW